MLPDSPYSLLAQSLQAFADLFEDDLRLVDGAWTLRIIAKNDFSTSVIPCAGTLALIWV